jgi:hypothetical protein
MVIDSSFNHVVSVHPVDIDSKTYLFLHCQIDDWSKTLRKKLIWILSKLGESYAVAYTPESIKFNKLLGAKVIATIEDHDPVLTVMRYN